MHNEKCSSDDCQEIHDIDFHDDSGVDMDQFLQMLQEENDAFEAMEETIFELLKTLETKATVQETEAFLLLMVVHVLSAMLTVSEGKEEMIDLLENHELMEQIIHIVINGVDSFMATLDNIDFPEVDYDEITQYVVDLKRKTALQTRLEAAFDDPIDRLKEEDSAELGINFFVKMDDIGVYPEDLLRTLLYYWAIYRLDPLDDFDEKLAKFTYYWDEEMSDPIITSLYKHLDMQDMLDDGDDDDDDEGIA